MPSPIAIEDLSAGFYSVPELADLLRISRTTVYRNHERGVLRGISLGGRIIFSKRAVADWLAYNSKADQPAVTDDEGDDK